MSRASRRTTLKLLGGVALSTTSLALPAAAQGEDLVVPNTYQNFKRGTIHSLHPERRIFNIVWEDLGRVKMRAADLVTNYPSLKVGNIVDTHWYDYLDFMIAPKTAQNDAQLHADILSWSRSQGLFAGVALEGATLRQDLDDNATLYGKKLENRDIVTSGVRPPQAAAKLLALLNRYSASEARAR